MEFKETEFGTEIIGLDKSLNQVGREGLREMEIERLKSSIESMRLAFAHHENHACPIFSEAHRTYSSLVTAVVYITKLEEDNERLRKTIQKVLIYNQGGAWGEDESPDEFMTAALRRED